MFKQKFKAVFFDWDNTLVDTWPIILKASNTVLQHFGFPKSTLDEVKVRARLSTREGFPQQFGENWQEAQKIFYQAIYKSKNELKIYDGVPEQLQQLKAAGYGVAIISNKTRDLLAEEIKQFNISSDLALGSGDTPYDKPHPEMGLIALKHFGLQPKDAVYIGDSVTDWEFANNLKMHAIAIGDDIYDGPLLARFATVKQPIDALLKNNSTR
jgi:phosphoglycolate phosphatase